MNLRPALTALRLPHLWARMRLIRDTEAYLRLHFLSFAGQCGLLEALREPASRGELVRRLHVERPDLLDLALELGVTLRELSCRRGRYRVRGGRARALLAEDGDAQLAMVQEMLGYHASVYLRLADHLRGAPAEDYLSEHGTLIARSSRMLEPFQRNFVRQVVPRAGPVRLLEIGCGSGVYLRYAAEWNPQLTGVAIDVQESVVEQARANLEAWGVAERFRVVVGDVRRPPAEAAGPFDVITLYNNVYYFEPSERPALFRRLGSLLAAGGTFALVSLMRGRTLLALDLDLALRCTDGCWALPELDELEGQLREAGFTRVGRTRLMPVEPFYGLVASEV